MAPQVMGTRAQTRMPNEFRCILKAAGPRPGRRLRDTPTSRDSRSRSVRLLRGWSRLARSADVLEQVVGAGRAGAVVLHRVAEELRDVVQPGALRVPDVLTVVVSRLERVVLDGNEIVGDVLEASLSGCHGLCLLSV